MPHIELDDDTYHELKELATAWNATMGDALGRLVTAVATGTTVQSGQPGTSRPDEQVRP